MDTAEYGKATDGLFDNTISRAEFDSRWVHFVCEALPKFESTELKSIAKRANRIANRNPTHPHVNAGHADFFKKIVDLITDRKNPNNNHAVHHFVAYALDLSCDIYPERLADWLFQKLPNKEVAQDLLAYQRATCSQWLSEFWEYLENTGVVSALEWPEDRAWPRLNGAKPHSYKMDSIFSERAQSEDFVSRAAKLDPLIADIFPNLQEQLDIASRNPAYTSAYPVASMIAGHIVKNGAPFHRHIALLGPPGTGKTEAAKLLKPILESLGVVGPQLRIYRPAGDQEGYIGHSEVEMKKILDELSVAGGMLIVDEAGQLYDGDGSDNGHFRERAMQVIQNSWEDLLQDNVLVVFAGYRQDFEHFVQSDPGWHSRLIMIDLEPPTVEKLAHEVWDYFYSHNVELPPNFEKNVKELFQRLRDDDSTNFGYWRTYESFVSSLSASTLGADVLVSGIGGEERITPESFARAAREIGYRNANVDKFSFESDLSSNMFDGLPVIPPPRIDPPPTESPGHGL